jgi:hypothetical protein
MLSLYCREILCIPLYPTKKSMKYLTSSGGCWQTIGQPKSGHMSHQCAMPQWDGSNLSESANWDAFFFYEGSVCQKSTQIPYERSDVVLKAH